MKLGAAALFLAYPRKFHYNSDTFTYIRSDLTPAGRYEPTR